MSLTHQAVSGVKWNSSAMVVRIGVQFLSLAVLARVLSPDDFGLMSMALVVTGFAQAFADFGLSNAIIHRQDATREQLSSLYWLNLAVGFVLFGGLWLATPLVVAYYQEPALTEVLQWAIASFLIVPIGQQFQSLLRRELRFRTLSIFQIVDSIFYAASAIGFALAGFGVMSLVWAALLRALINTSLLVSVAVRSHWLPALHFRRADLSGFVGFGLFQMGERSLNYLATNVDYLIIGRFLGTDALGYYTLAYNLIRMPLVYINPVLVSVAFPAFARVQMRDDLLRAGYGKMLRYLSAVSFPIMAGMLVVAPLFVPLVYGPQWLPAVPVIQIFCLLGALKGLSNPLGSLLLAKGKADLGFYLNVLAIVGYAASNLFGVRWGITGVATSGLLFSTLVLMPLDFYLRWRIIRMSVKEFWVAIRYPLYASLSMLGALVLAQWLLPPLEHTWLVLAFLILIGVALYGGVLWILDRPFLTEAWGHLKLAPVRRS